jgi:predicted nucleic acid-binding protein
MSFWPLRWPQQVCRRSARPRGHAFGHAADLQSVIVVDSSVWIANLRDSETEMVRRLRELPDDEQIIVGDVVLLEILQGARDDLQAVRIENGLRRFDVVPMLDGALAVRAAANYRLLRSRGITVRKTVDLIIGTFCIERDHRLLHDDRDFDPMVAHLGLRLA